MREALVFRSSGTCCHRSFVYVSLLRCSWFPNAIVCATFATLSLRGPHPTMCCIKNTLAPGQPGIRVAIVTRCKSRSRHSRTICASSSATTPRQWRMSSLTLGQSNGVRGFLCKAEPCRTWLPACFWFRAHPHHSPRAQCLRGSPRGLAAQSISTFSSGLTGPSGWVRVGGCA